MIDYHRLRNWVFPEIEHRYTEDDSMRYALALGFGADPVDARQLQFVNDVQPDQPRAFPTLAVVLGFPGSWMADPATGIDFARIVHGEEHLVLHRMLPASGTVRARHQVVRVVDKGAGRGAVITYAKHLFDHAGGELLATVTHTTFARADGGFAANGGRSDAPSAPPPPLPERGPDRQCELATLPQQALLYRLCADRNPLHSDPGVAQAAGFARPILHGLCTYGMAARALLAECADHGAHRLKSLFARFSAPVYPGETLQFDFFLERSLVRFRARVKERAVVVLDQGCAELAD